MFDYIGLAVLSTSQPVGFVSETGAHGPSDDSQPQKTALFSLFRKHFILKIVGFFFFSVEDTAETENEQYKY